MARFARGVAEAAGSHGADVDRLLARVSELAAPGSEVLFDVASNAVLASPSMNERLEFVASLGAPWHFSTEPPEALLEPLG